MAAAAGMNLQNQAPPQQVANPREYHEEDLIVILRGDEVIFRCPPEGARIQPLLQIESTISRIALGAIAAITSIPVINFLTDKVVALMESRGIEFTADQDIVAIWKGVDGMLAKAALITYVVFLGPFLEELLFRGFLQSTTRWIQDSDDLLARIIRVLVNALIFAAMHLSPAQGYTNVPVFIGTFLGGCVLAAQREITGGIVSPTTTHILHNGTAMAQFLLRA